MYIKNYIHCCEKFYIPPAIGFEKIFAKVIINLYDFMAKKAVSKTIACTCRQSTKQTLLTTTVTEKNPYGPSINYFIKNMRKGLTKNDNLSSFSKLIRMSG